MRLPCCFDRLAAAIDGFTKPSACADAATKPDETKRPTKSLR